LIEKEGFGIILLSQWKIIVLAGIIGAAFGLIYSLLKKPVYR
jgi:LPS O-antigen subunit length determinant protein (WzzB/FepE family)